MVSVKKIQMTSLDGPDGDGITPPDADALLEARKAEIKEAAEKAEVEEPVLKEEEEDQAVDLIHAGRVEGYFEIFTRRIHLRTLTIEEELKVSDITKRYL